MCLLDLKSVEGDIDLLSTVQNMMERLKGAMSVEVIFADISGEKRAKLVEVLKKKKMKLDIEEQLKSVNFLLVNEFEDWWFHSDDLLSYGYT